MTDHSDADRAVIKSVIIRALGSWEGVPAEIEVQRSSAPLDHQVDDPIIVTRGGEKYAVTVTKLED